MGLQGWDAAGAAAGPRLGLMLMLPPAAAVYIGWGPMHMLPGEESRRQLQLQPPPAPSNHLHLLPTSLRVR